MKLLLNEKGSADVRRNALHISVEHLAVSLIKKVLVASALEAVRQLHFSVRNLQLNSSPSLR
jgi:hypothetical protein